MIEDYYDFPTGSDFGAVGSKPPSQPRQFAVTIAVRSWWLSGLREGRTH
jgi:hypothetical protein